MVGNTPFFVIFLQVNIAESQRLVEEKPQLNPKINESKKIIFYDYRLFDLIERDRTDC